MTVLDLYTLKAQDTKKNLNILIKANDSNHAQAQGLDISRALNANSFTLSYGSVKETDLSKLFEKLAFNTFSHTECCIWEGSKVNDVPCLYALSHRYYVRNLIIRYLDIPIDNCCVRLTCKNKHCINPYHFSYATGKNSKLTGGDVKLLLAYDGQGASISQVASALNVHRSTIYRKLKNERFCSGSKSN